MTAPQPLDYDVTLPTALRSLAWTLTKWFALGAVTIVAAGIALSVITLLIMVTLVLYMVSIVLLLVLL